MNNETKKQTILGYLFLIPSLAVFAVFMFYPLLYTFYLSFFEWNMVKPVKKFVGLNNYIAVFRDPNTFKILGNTLAYILVLLVLNFVLPYILSFILSAVIRHGKSFYKAVFFLPSVISLVVGSILYTWILNPISGLVQNRRMGHCRALHHYHLEDLRLQLHQYFSRCLRRIPGSY